MSNVSRFVLGLVAALTAGPALAEPIAADPELGALYAPGGLTAELAARRARLASPSVWRQVAELEAQLASVAAARLGRLPVVSTKLAYTRLSDLEQQPLAIGAGGSPGFTFPVLLDSYVAQAQVVVPLSDQVLRHPHAIGAAKLAAEVARDSAHASARDAASQARHAYYEWIRARLQLVISQRQLAQVQGNLGRIRELVAAGRAPRADLLRIESQEAESEQQVDRLRTTAELRERILRLQIGARPDESIAIGEDVRVDLAVPAATPSAELADGAVARRPDLRALRLAAEAAEAKRLAERANQLPKLSAFAAAEYANPNQRVFPADARFELTWSAGVQLTWTLNDALIARTTKHRFAAEARALAADHEAAKREVQIAVLSAQQHLDNARRAIATTAKGLDAAEEGYRVRRALLAAERVTAVELVDAETELARARIAALDARIDLRIALADLDHAIGTDR